MFIDTHTHLYVSDYDADREAVILRAREAGAVALLQPNVDASSVEPMLRLCDAHPDLCYPMIGLHPTELPATDVDATLDEMEHLLDANPSRFIAIGEVGLDFYWDASRAEEQLAAFQRQIQWALRYDLPIMIHSRSAHRQLVNALLPYADRLRGVFHCFSGSREEAEELLRRFPRFALGIGGVLTFKKCKLPDTLLQSVPLSRIVLETDAPWLAPTPHRGERNESAYIPLVIEKLAEIYQLTPEDIATATTSNATAIFSLLPTS